MLDLAKQQEITRQQELKTKEAEHQARELFLGCPRSLIATAA